MLKIHPNVNEDNVKKIMKIFHGMFAPFKINVDTEERDGFTVYPAGPTHIKTKLEKFFPSETSPKEIAEYLLLVTENRIKETNKNSF